MFGRTRRAVALVVRELMRTFTWARFLMFFTQSAPSPPPLSRYNVPARVANQISKVAAGAASASCATVSRRAHRGTSW